MIPVRFGKIDPLIIPIRAMQCAICLTDPISHCFVGCGHACMCEMCAEHVNNSTRRCPICRGQSNILKLYFPQEIVSNDELEVLREEIAKAKDEATKVKDEATKLKQHADSLKTKIKMHQPKAMKEMQKAMKSNADFLHGAPQHIADIFTADDWYYQPCSPNDFKGHSDEVLLIIYDHGWIVQRGTYTERYGKRYINGQPMHEARWGVRANYWYRVPKAIH